MNKKPILLLYALGVIAFVGYGLCILAIFGSFLSSDLPERTSCFRSECFEEVFLVLEPAFSIGKAASDLLITVATVGGIVVALLSYFSAVSNSALANHISHFSTFQSYMNNEIAKRGRLHASSIDVFKWYNSVFPDSKLGVMTVAVGYKDFVQTLNSRVDESNQLANTATGESFRYKPHQVAMRSHLELIGINLSLQPRIEYYEIEDQIMSLIGCVNNAFCLNSHIPALLVRRYA
jgi:hypothetical protein